MSRLKFSSDEERIQYYNHIKELENNYKASFKGNSCRAILDAYYDLIAAKSIYNKKTEQSFEKQVMDDVLKDMDNSDDDF